MANALCYTTQDGDTLDMIALDMYNDEYKAGIIAAANPQVAGTIVFADGVKLVIPIIDEPAANTMPPWKRG